MQKSNLTETGVAISPTTPSAVLEVICMPSTRVLQDRWRSPDLPGFLCCDFSKRGGTDIDLPAAGTLDPFTFPRDQEATSGSDKLARKLYKGGVDIQEIGKLCRNEDQQKLRSERASKMGAFSPHIRAQEHAANPLSLTLPYM